jgi:hypothetical protein
MSRSGECQVFFRERVFVLQESVTFLLLEKKLQVDGKRGKSRGESQRYLRTRRATAQFSESSDFEEMRNSGKNLCE